MNDWTDPKNSRIQIGITPPKKLANTADEMRLAIREASRESALIMNALNSGRYNGLSGEDTYVLLAYHALIELERFWQLTMERAALDPFPRMVVPAKLSGEQS